MDIATIIGLVAGAGLLLWAILMGGPLSTFIDVPSILIVIGGATAATLVSFPLRNLLTFIRVLKNAFFSKPQSATVLIKDLVQYAEVARRDGILSLESVVADVKDPFIVGGIQMAVDGTDPELIERIMTEEMESVAARHASGKAILECVGKYAPAYGMLGTLIGLVLMLKNMDDPSKIGPGMAVALLTTLYGSLVANFFALPLADKLGVRSNDELLLKMIVIKGVMGIQAGDNPRVVEQKLKSYLPHSVRRTMTAREAA